MSNKYAIHMVEVEAVSMISNPEDEAVVVGRTDGQVGITKFVDDLLKFFDENFLGLQTTGLAPGVPPTIQAPAGSYRWTVQEDEGGNDVFLQSARLMYQATTDIFHRSATDGYPVSMGQLLLAMKQKLIDTTVLRYLNDVRIVSGDWIASPFNQYTVYLRPYGSPEVETSE